MDGILPIWLQKGHSLVFLIWYTFCQKTKKILMEHNGLNV